jgi:pimeloyl-ACP methyl ester carboxylesterase
MTKSEFRVGEETLVGQKIGSGKPTILYLHGAGNSTKERGLPIMVKLAEAGLSIFCFDFSGHGESTGEMKNSSLEKRLSESQAALSFLDDKKPVTVIASSMAGHIALELVKRCPRVKNLILFYPAVYATKAFKIPFTEAFSDIIRQPNSWKDNDVMGSLQQFTGNLLVIIGGKRQGYSQGSDRDDLLQRE